MKTLKHFKRLMIVGLLLTTPACIVETEDPSANGETTEEVVDQGLLEQGLPEADGNDDQAREQWLTLEQWLSGNHTVVVGDPNPAGFEQDAPPQASSAGISAEKGEKSDSDDGLHGSSSNVGREDEGPDPDPWNEAYSTHSGPDPDPWHPYDP